MAKKDAAKPKTPTPPGKAPPKKTTAAKKAPAAASKKPASAVVREEVREPKSAKPTEGAKPKTRAIKHDSGGPTSELDRVKLELARSKEEADRTRKALRELDGERRRLTTVAEKTERALTEEAQRRSTLERKLETTGDLAAAQAKISELKLKVEVGHSEVESLRAKAHRGELAEQELQAMNFERSQVAKKLAELEALARKPSPQLVEELRKEADARAESKVRALTNERDGLRSRLKELEATSAGAADRAKTERLEEKCMELVLERDSYKERLTEAEAQSAFAPSAEVMDRLKTSLADAERDRDRYREKVIDLEAQVVAMRGGLPLSHHGRMSSAELQSRLEEAEREREKAERERDELEKRVHALKTDLYARKNAPEDSDKRFCPGCGTEMRSTVSSSVRMDVCPQCSGVYFAKGEIASIIAQEREVVKQAAKGSFFGRIFGKVEKP
jgi:DNA repair exonuclease SbcCD ATPase subunit